MIAQPPTDHGHRDGHEHPVVSAESDRRWLSAALAVILLFMVGEVIVGLLVHSLALITDAGHMLSDAAALGLAVIASRLAQRPARGRFTYGFARVDALSAQANGITLLLLAGWFVFEAIRRLAHPPAVEGAPVVIVAVVGIGANLLALTLTGRANRNSLNIRGAFAHLINDLWAFLATAISGVVVLATGWTRADAVASLVIAALMVWTGYGLVHSASRVFLEAAPRGLDPRVIGEDMAAVDGVSEVHDLHVWDLGAAEPALSAHIVVSPAHDCHKVAHEVRAVLAASHHIDHATLQADHRHDKQPLLGDDCAVRHGPGYVSGD